MIMPMVSSQLDCRARPVNAYLAVDGNYPMLSFAIRGKLAVDEENSNHQVILIVSIMRSGDF